ncbi:TPA: DNA repair and recombination protein RadB [Candidatus Woesearchaeota archaeon]|nr:DNA repair and recombination protein RadB [Candidatus Woesearchaeota archaeon]HIG93364.1 DNA repair and recombination protein RadB [Candidatus Woesearchaeota archaeon]HIH12536.1 DNA repair and recombination protein RadB [Candidatus Woesearchaeota archaeon]
MENYWDETNGKMERSGIGGNMTKISTGAVFLDAFLGGGYDEDIVTTLYGPSGTGKTNLCLLAAVQMAKSGKKVIIIDTEGGIAVERIRQITPQYEEVLTRILFFNPYTFDEQKDIFEKMKELAGEQIGLIVVDSISMLYRLELGKNEEVYEINSALGKQLAYLVEIARRRKIPVLITNQVYSDFDNRDSVKMVGGDLLKYSSKCLIEMHRFSNCRGLTLRKHRSLPEGKEVKFVIVKEGIEEVK